MAMMVEHQPLMRRLSMDGPESEGWKKAFAAEVKSLDDNMVYAVVDRPFGKKVVRAKWVLRRNLLPSG